MSDGAANAAPAAASAARDQAQGSTRFSRGVLLLLIAVIYLPEEISFYIGDSRLTLARLMLIALSPWLGVEFFRMLKRPGARVAVADVLFPLAGLWMLAANAIILGPAKAASSVAIVAMEFIMPYMAARLLTRRDDDVVFAIRTYCIATAVVALLAPLDSISSSFVAHDWGRALTGYVRLDHIDYRMGLLRASSTLEHPILLGTVCTISLLLSSVLRPPLRWTVRVVCFSALVLSFSSAPMGGLLLGLAIKAYGRIFRQLRQRWAALGIAVASVLAVVFVFSHNPLGFVLSNLTFDPESAYFRLLIWDYGTATLNTSPLLGIGLDSDWFREPWMPKSVDSYWLCSALNYGIPGAVLMASAWLAPFVFPAEREDLETTSSIPLADLRFMLNVVMLVVFYIGCTVHFWGTSWMLISFLVGLRARLGAAPAKQVATQAMQRPSRRLVMAQAQFRLLEQPRVGALSPPAGGRADDSQIP